MSNEWQIILSFIEEYIKFLLIQNANFILSLIILNLFLDFLFNLYMNVSVPDVYSSLLGWVGRSLEVSCSIVPTESTFVYTPAPNNEKDRGG